MNNLIDQDYFSLFLKKKWDSKLLEQKNYLQLCAFLKWREELFSKKIIIN